MTRAKDDLHLMVPQRFFTHGQSAQGDRHVYASRTRFIPDRLLDLFERTTWPLAAAGAAAARGQQRPAHRRRRAHARHVALILRPRASPSTHPVRASP